MNTKAMTESPQSSIRLKLTAQANTSKAQKTNAVIKTPKELADQYTFVQELGHGTQAHVYKALDKSNHKYVAIKQLRIDSIQTWKEYDLFMREAKTLKSLDIPGVVKFEDAMEFLNIEHPAAYIVQEYIPGRSLGEMMRANYRFTAQQIFRFAIKLLTILKRLHSHYPPIIHRDIKPSNILFKPQLTGDEFDLYLIDFGAVANPQIQSGGSTVAGTFGYMPPEQLMGKASPASDIYALGATIAYMLSGVEPASMQVSDFRLLIDPHLESIPKRVVATLRQMLDPDISKRLCDYDELIARFMQYANNVFTITQSDGPDYLNIDLDEKLKSVSAYCQEGNFEMWDMLSDNTPRAIPTIYQKLNTNALPEMISFNDTISKLLYLSYKLSFIIGIIITLIWGLGLAGSAVIILIIHLIKHPQLDLILISLILIPLGLFFIICLTRMTLKYHSSALKQRCMPYRNKFLSKFNTYLSKMNQQSSSYILLLTAGTKTIATIVEVSYKRVNNLLVEPYIYTKKFQQNQNTENEQSVGGYCHYQAAFTIRYKFNPPDDSSPYDLVHEVTTYTDCENTLKPGDLLPILYYINPSDNNEVWSTPFPVPYSDFVNVDDLIGYSYEGSPYLL